MVCTFCGETEFKCRCRRAPISAETAARIKAISADGVQEALRILRAEVIEVIIVEKGLP